MHALFHRVQPCPCHQLYLFPGLSLLFFLEWEERDSLLTGFFLIIHFFSLMGCDYSLAFLIRLHVTWRDWTVVPLAPLVKHSILSVPTGPQLAFLIQALLSPPSKYPVKLQDYESELPARALRLAVDVCQPSVLYQHWREFE